MEYKEALSIELYDAKILLYTNKYPEGVFWVGVDRGKYVINGEELCTLLQFIDIPFREYADLKNLKTGKYERYPLESLEFPIVHEQLGSNYHEAYQSRPDNIYVCEIENGLKIKLEYKNEDEIWYDYISYKGNYAIRWKRD